uniref:Uncharacterized protein n=1 Tax=Rhodnius prolixus TaxID=13249 RepID=T1H833_RHOPR
MSTVRTEKLPSGDNTSLSTDSCCQREDRKAMSFKSSSSGHICAFQGCM